FFVPLVESWASTLQNVHHRFVNYRVLESAAQIVHAIIVFLVQFCTDHLLRIANNSEIWIVSNNKYLSSPLRFLHTWHEQLVYRLVIQVFLGLVNYKGNVVIVDK